MTCRHVPARIMLDSGWERAGRPLAATLHAGTRSDRTAPIDRHRSRHGAAV